MSPDSWPPSGATHRAQRRSGATVVRAMTAADIDALMLFEREMFGTEAWTRNGYHGELADTRHRYYIAADSADGELIGWGGVMIVGDTADILTVGVIPTARRTGAARLMVAELLAEARRRGVVDVFLEVRVDNAAARALYASEGFTEAGVRRGYYDAGRVDAVTMCKRLAPE